MHYSDLLFLLLSFFTEAIGTISGFGSSVIFVPLASIIFDLKTTLALTGILHVFSTSAQLFLFRRSINLKLILKIGIPSIVMVLIGAQMHAYVDIRFAQSIMGIFLVIFSLTFLTKDHLKFKVNNFNIITGGSIAGFLAGLVGTGGAIRGATLTALSLQKDVFIATSAGIDLGVDLARSLVYLSNDFLDEKYFWYVPILFVTAFSGSWLGKQFLNYIPEKSFKKIVLLFIMGIGFFTIYGAIAH